MVEEKKREEQAQWRVIEREWREKEFMEGKMRWVGRIESGGGGVREEG